MAKVMIVGAGGVSNVVASKCAAQQEFSDILLASRTIEKCNQIAENIGSPKITTAKLDADNVSETVGLIKDFRPDILINVALPYQDLHLMDACLETGVDYLDTANYEPPEEAKFEYSWQWNYHDRFKNAGITAILGCGFDPGVTGVFTAYAQKHHFDEIHYLDIVDCNAGNHGQAFATNFNPEINIKPSEIKVVPADTFSTNFIPTLGVNLSEMESDVVLDKYKIGIAGSSGIALLSTKSSEVVL